MSILFKNIAKPANDLLSKSKYTTGGAKKFGIKTKTSNGTNFKAEANIVGGSVSGKIGTDLKHESGFTVKKIELDNKGTLTTEITLDKALDNVVFAVNAKIQPLATSNPTELTTIGATFKNDDLQADLIVSPFDPAAANFSLCVKRDDFYFGGAAGVKFDDKAGSVDVSAYDFGVAYVKAGGAASFTVKNKLSAYQFGFFHKHSDKISFAATLGGKVDPKAGGALEFGGSYEIDAGTTAHSKLSFPNGDSASASFSFNVDHQLNSSAKLGLTSVLPVELNGAPQFGLNLSLGI